MSDTQNANTQLLDVARDLFQTEGYKPDTRRMRGDERLKILFSSWCKLNPNEPHSWGEYKAAVRSRIYQASSEEERRLLREARKAIRANSETTVEPVTKEMRLLIIFATICENELCCQYTWDGYLHSLEGQPLHATSLAA